MYVYLCARHSVLRIVLRQMMHEVDSVAATAFEGPGFPRLLWSDRAELELVSFARSHHSLLVARGHVFVLSQFCRPGTWVSPMAENVLLKQARIPSHENRAVPPVPLSSTGRFCGGQNIFFPMLCARVSLQPLDMYVHTAAPTPYVCMHICMHICMHNFLVQHRDIFHPPDAKTRQGDGGERQSRPSTMQPAPAAKPSPPPQNPRECSLGVLLLFFPTLSRPKPEVTSDG